MEIIGFYFLASLSLLSVSNGKFPSCNRPLFTDHQIHHKSPRWDLRLFFVQHAEWPKFSTKKNFFFGGENASPGEIGRWLTAPLTHWRPMSLHSTWIDFFFIFFLNLKEKSNFKTETRWSLKVTLIALYFSGIPVASAHTGSPGTGPSDNRGQWQLWGDLNGFL